MKALKKLGFDIGYLAMLTKGDVKPLSRWESKFSRGQVKALQHLGLKTNTVERKLLNGGTITELIFSKSSRYLDFYARRFHKTPVRKNRQTVLTEGFLFGYPSCCVRNFAENGYTENSFVDNGQEILFHWACPGCRVTPSLLPYYRKTHQECRELLAGQKPTVPEVLKKSLPAAALSLLFALVAPWKAKAEDPHWYSPSAIDTTGDFLNDSEELLLGTAWGGFIGGVPHGPREALRLSAIINSLPDTSCFIQLHLADGNENCQICGETMNMGFVSIHNPRRGLCIWIHFMGLHYMEHGSFSYDGTTNSGRVDIELLKEILAHYDTDHFSVETSNDADDDGLRDDYEDDFGTQVGISDSDGDGIGDGAQVAESLVEAISQLPDSCISYDVLYGLVNCDICGMPVNMGSVHIINPVNETSIVFPILGLHYLAHGRFAYAPPFTGDGEVDALQLAKVLGIITSVPSEEPLPREHGLRLSNHPNPFNAGTQIEFSLREAGHATLRIYNTAGQLVRTLLDENPGTGNHRVRWDGLDEAGERVASGLYFCRLKAGDFCKTIKMVLVR